MILSLNCYVTSAAITDGMIPYEVYMIGVCLLGMWKGLFPRIIMIGTLTALQWFIYDSVKVYFRLPRPPPPEMPESLKKKLAAAQ